MISVATSCDAQLVGLHLRIGHLPVQRQPGVQQRLVGGPRVHPGEQRPVDGQAGALHAGRHRQVEEDDGVSDQLRPGCVGQHRSAAEREDAGMLGERGQHRRLLQFAETRLAVLQEDVRDGPAGRRLDVGVGVAERQAGRPGERRAPTVDLPDPGGPTSTTTGRIADGPWPMQRGAGWASIPGARTAGSAMVAASLAAPRRPVRAASARPQSAGSASGRPGLPGWRGRRARSGGPR